MALQLQRCAMRGMKLGAPGDGCVQPGLLRLRGYVMLQQKSKNLATAILRRKTDQAMIRGTVQDMPKYALKSSCMYSVASQHLL